MDLGAHSDLSIHQSCALYHMHTDTHKFAYTQPLWPLSSPVLRSHVSVTTNLCQGPVKCCQSGCYCSSIFWPQFPSCQHWGSHRLVTHGVPWGLGTRHPQLSVPCTVGIRKEPAHFIRHQGSLEPCWGSWTAYITSLKYLFSNPPTTLHSLSFPSQPRFEAQVGK